MSVYDRSRLTESVSRHH